MLFAGRADDYIAHRCLNTLAGGSFDEPTTRYRDNHLAFEMNMCGRLGPGIDANESNIEFIAGCWAL
jgi:hypothetical protein